MLLIPMARSRILEVLCGVTMVCFIDGDVVCEEIFLLADNPGSPDSVSGNRRRKSTVDEERLKQTGSENNKERLDAGAAPKMILNSNRRGNLR